MGLKALAALPRLHTLLLGEGKITDAGCQELAHLKGLRKLNLEYSDVGDASAAGRGRVDGVASCHLDRTQVTGAGLNILVGLQELAYCTCPRRKWMTPG